MMYGGGGVSGTNLAGIATAIVLFINHCKKCGPKFFCSTPPPQNLAHSVFKI
jgi:hypothetical protein